jgi:hypothetical protein
MSLPYCGHLAGCARIENLFSHWAIAFDGIVLPISGVTPRFSSAEDFRSSRRPTWLLRKRCLKTNNSNCLWFLHRLHFWPKIALLCFELPDPHHFHWSHFNIGPNFLEWQNEQSISLGWLSSLCLYPLKSWPRPDCLSGDNVHRRDLSQGQDYQGLRREHSLEVDWHRLLFLHRLKSWMMRT